ncbi:hypothetical protein IL306_000346 [Fusarium sp. DS 682]|nr:hypothetical protein IL306_000346 [Fusarium sp. DS 682]
MNQQSVSQSPEAGSEEGGRSPITIRFKHELKRLLRDLNELSTKPPSIYLDASDIGSGELTNLHLFIPPTRSLYLVNLRRLGENAFSPIGNTKTSFREVLESKDIPKVGFDIRDISRLLFRQYNVSLAGIHDLQLMELASRKDGESKKFLSGLQKCINQDLPSSNMEKIRRLNTEETTNMHLYNTFGHNPNGSMRRIEIFPELWSVYNRRLSREKNSVWLHLMRQESEQRVHDSKRKAGSYPERQRWGPEVFWDHEQRQIAIDAWNNGILLEERLGGVEISDDAE